MAYQIIGFVGCGLVCCYSILNSYRNNDSHFSTCTGLLGSSCIMYYSVLNNIWPTFITNFVLFATVFIKFAFKDILRQNQDTENRNASTSTRDESIIVD